MRFTGYGIAGPCLIVLFGLALGSVAAVYTARGNARQASTQLGHLAEGAATRLRERLRLNEYGVRGARGAMISAESPSKDTFARYGRSRDLVREFPGVLAFGFAGREPDGRIVVQYVAPADDAGGLLGKDLASTPSVLAATDASAQSGQPVLSAPLTIDSPTSASANVLLLTLPVFPGDEQRPDVLNRASPSGWVFAELSIADVIESLDDQGGQIALVLTDVTERAPVALGGRNAPAPSGARRTRKLVEIFGRRLELDVASTHAFQAVAGETKPSWVGGAIGSLASLVALVVYLRGRRRAMDVADLERHIANRTAELQTTVAQLAAAQRVAELGSWEMSVASGDVVWSEELFKIFGLPVSDRAPHYSQQARLFSPESWAQLTSAVQSSIESGRGYELTLHTVRDGGTQGVGVARAEIIRDSHGKIAKLVGTFQDTTERARSETRTQQITALLLKSEALQRAILSHAGSAIIATDCDGVITMFNRAAEELLGYSSDELVGKLTPATFHDAVEVNARRATLERELGSPIERPFDVFVARAKTGDADAGEWTYVKRDGTRVPVLLTVTSLRDDSGTITGFLGVAVNLTERKQRESELRELNRLLANQSAQLETLLQEVHHRVKNNLQVIASLIRMQVRQLRDEGARAALLEAQSRVASIALIHERLYQSRDYSRVPFSDYAAALARNIVDAMGASLSSVGLELNIEPLSLPVDRAIPCGLILNELLTNALKHAFPDGRGGRLAVDVKRRSETEVMLCVADNGIGFSGDLTAHGKQSLGLQLVTTLVEQLNGRVQFSSQNGTTCRIWFSQSEANE